MPHRDLAVLDAARRAADGVVALTDRPPRPGRRPTPPAGHRARRGGGDDPAPRRELPGEPGRGGALLADPQPARGDREDGGLPAAPLTRDTDRRFFFAVADRPLAGFRGPSAVVLRLRLR